MMYLKMPSRGNPKAGQVVGAAMQVELVGEVRSTILVCAGHQQKDRALPQSN